MYRLEGEIIYYRKNLLIYLGIYYETEWNKTEKSIYFKFIQKFELFFALKKFTNRNTRKKVSHD